MLLCCLCSALLVGLAGSTTALWQVKFGSPESQHNLCWVQGTLNYSFVLTGRLLAAHSACQSLDATGHIWSIGLACRTLAVLMVRVSPGASTQDSQNLWQWIDSNVTVVRVPLNSPECTMSTLHYVTICDQCRVSTHPAIPCIESLHLVQGNVFITNCLANAAAGSTILACSAHDEPHHLVVTGAGALRLVTIAV